jgi:hypothetical protein
MFDLTASSGVSRRIVHVVGLSILLTGVILAITRDAFGPFFLVMAIGAVVGGGLSLVMARRASRTPPLNVSDPFQRDTLGTTVIDVNRVRVAGFGGLGLVVMAVTLALVVPGIGVALALGLVGGILLSFALASYRRHHAGRWP